MKNQHSRAKQSIDPNTHRRLLRFINRARTPEDLTFAPVNEYKADPQETLERPDVDQPMQQRPRKQLLELEEAREIIADRDRLNPLRGYSHIDQLYDRWRAEWLGEYLKQLLHDLSMRCLANGSTAP